MTSLPFFERRDWLTRRSRRLRRTPGIRALVEEARVRREDLVAPVFVREGAGDPEPVGSMPGVHRFSVDGLVAECQRLRELGLRAVALFPCIESSRKDAQGTHGLDGDNVTYRAIRAVKAGVPDLVVVTDVALDPYTDHGHDGVLSADGRDVDNDATLAVLAQMAVMQAEAGCDVVAPSDMMDGRVRALRAALDEGGHQGIAILSYAAKFASSLYGPFRDAVGSSQAAGTRHLDKCTYQLNPANAREAMSDALLDVEEGADLLMVKPAGWYLDVIAGLRARTDLPIAAYQISGEYSQIHAAARAGWLDLDKARDESLLAIKRAGADLILTYFSADFAAAAGD